ncbi:MAG: retroviral-like aspartic protease family protein [bacterium]
MSSYRDPYWGGPPAPLVDVRFSWRAQDRVVLGILDTGADHTQLPEDVAHELRLRAISDIPITDANGNQQMRYIYLADVEFEGVNFPSRPVVGSNLPIALVGRDILNEFVSTFDGPARDFLLRR